MLSLLQRLDTSRSLNLSRTFTSSAITAARRTRAARVSHSIPSTVPPIPVGAPENWKRPSYRPVPHLSITKGGSYSHLFQTRTRWIARALSEGQHIPRNLLYKLLRHREISPDSLAVWVDILNKRDPIYALEKLGLLESASRADELQQHSSTTTETKPECPDWLYLSIPAMVTNHQQAPYLASQLLSNRFARQLDEKSRSIFLARCIQHFIKVKHFVALRETIEFITFSRNDSKTTGSGGGGGTIWREASFGRILEALASERERTGRISAAPNELLHSSRHVVLSTMKERNVSRKSLVTWLPLFMPALIPQDPRQAMDLLVEMTEAGWSPKRRVLHQVLKVVVRNGGVEGNEAAAKIKEELSRVRNGLKQSEWIHSQLSNRADEIPLHLREQRGGKGDLDQKEEETDEAQQLQEEEAVFQRSTATPDAFEEDTATASHTLEVESESQTSLLIDPSISATSHPSMSHPSQPRINRRTRSLNDIYSTTQLFDRSISLAYFAQLRQYVSTHRRPLPPFPRPPFPSSSVAWAAFFQSVVHEPSIGSKLLLSVLRKLELVSSPSYTTASSSNSYVPPPPGLRLYTIIMRCLLARNNPRRVLSIFMSLESKGYGLDSTILDLQIRALCSLGREREAIRLVRFYEHLPSIHDPSSLVSLRSPPTNSNIRRPHSIRLDIVPFNTILSHLNQMGKYQEVYSLFKELESKHEVRPDVATMSILLDAARYASVEAGRGVGGFGIEDGLGQVHFGGKRNSRRTGRLGADSRLTGVVDDKWDRIAAAKRMELLVWDQIFEANWQEVEIENSLETKSGMSKWIQDHFSSSSSSSTSSGSKSKSKKGQSFVDRSEAPSNWRPFVSTLSPRPPLHPDIHPTDQFFRSLILLTGVHSHIPLIGQILAWARYTNVKLSRYTLCLALLYVEGDAGVKRDKIEKLRKWLRDWLGQENVPSEEEIAWMRRGGTVKGKPQVR
ncbi:uncharacterized protein JCM6883_002704 [Sporobolomyces salmoneus]|uniref:uncharacterized protein n=1 Tax=Sporobolomyces salmoneus TaxID=183962 RepID=UPI0031786DC3